MRAVIDTSVLVSGLIRPQGPPGAVMRALRDGKFTAIYSHETLIEFVEVLGRDFIRSKYQVQAEDISALVSLIRLRGEAVAPTQKVSDCRDPKDNKFLEAALAGEVDYIVSGDDDLLSMNPYQDIPVLSPLDFLKVL
jgi:putative PIN family toxin of toxin-antitoxin system